jgi:hypothetical protein
LRNLEGIYRGQNCCSRLTKRRFDRQKMQAASRLSETYGERF